MLHYGLTESWGNMSGIVERILKVKVSSEDMRRALKAVNALTPADRRDPVMHALCLVRLFGGSATNDVTLHVTALEWRLQALARLAGRPEFKAWSMPGAHDAVEITPDVLEATAAEPLIEVDNRPGFDADAFFKRLLTITKGHGHG
jgi:hypothetical protein